MRLSRRLGLVKPSACDLAAYLIEEFALAVVAGEDFGAPANIRISYATSMANLEKGMDRLERALAPLA
jgi:aspartate/methionine/tyrosine aminotransferase